MRALNAKGILHRDLKPQNILLRFDPKYPPKDRRGTRQYPRPEEIMLKIGNFKCHFILLNFSVIYIARLSCNDLKQKRLNLKIRKIR